MIELKSLRAENFLSWYELDFDFTDKDLCLMVGANGAGKSSIPSAVAWALYGKTQKGLQGDDVINWNHNGDAYVMLRFEIDGKPCVVQRWRGSCNDLSIKIAVDEIEGTNTEKQKVLTELLNADFQTFINTSFFSQGKIKFLGEATDTERKTLFKRILDLSQFDRAYSNTKEQIIENLTLKRNLEKEELKAEQQIEMITLEFGHRKELADNFESLKQEKLNELDDQIKKLVKKATSEDMNREQQIENIHDMQEYKELQEYINEHANIVENRQEAEAKLSKIMSELAIAELGIQNAKGDLEYISQKQICPTCKRPLDNDDLVKEHEAKIIAFKAKAKKLVRTGDIFDKEAMKLRKKETEWHKANEEYTKLRTEIQIAQQQKALEDADCRRLQEQFDQLRGQENPFPGDMEVIRNQIDAASDYLAEIKEKIYHIERQLQLLEEVKEIFSKRGVISFIMENYFQHLSSKANYYLSLLGVDMSIDIQAQKETKAGEKREEITIDITTEGHKAIYENLSDGQRQRLNIVLLFSLYSLCRSINVSNFDVLFLDEILDLSLDSASKEFVIDLLRIISKEENIPHILVISHSETIKEQFEEVLEIEKTEGGSIINAKIY